MSPRTKWQQARHDQRLCSSLYTEALQGREQHPPKPIVLQVWSHHKQRYLSHSRAQQPQHSRAHHHSPRAQHRHVGCGKISIKARATPALEEQGQHVEARVCVREGGTCSRRHGECSAE